MISHKTLYISDYIFSCYAFLFIFDFPNPLSKHILQFHAFLYTKDSFEGTGRDRRKEKSMKAARNSGICMKLDDFTGVLSLEHLDVNTMVYLYSEQGELIGKIHSTKSSATFTLPQKGMYVLVIHCLSYPVEVRRVIY